MKAIKKVNIGGSTDVQLSMLRVLAPSVNKTTDALVAAAIEAAHAEEAVAQSGGLERFDRAYDAVEERRSCI